MSLGRASNVLVLASKSPLCQRLLIPISASGVPERHFTSDPYKLEEIRAIRDKKTWTWFNGRFPIWCYWFDRTIKKLNENSKVINIQGPMGVGKHDMAKKLAERCDLKLFPEVTCDDLFVLNNGFDMRELNDQLPPWLRFVDFDAFYAEPNPKWMPGIARTQLQLYADRLHRYAKALSHLLNTGQGVVTVGGVFQDKCYADILGKKKYFTKEGYKFYKEFRMNSICQVPKPHVIIHIDAPTSFIREQIKKRNVPSEVNSPVLTDEYIDMLRSNIKENVQGYKKNCEVLKFDARDPDIDIVIERLEALKLDPDILSEDMHEDWNLPHDEFFDIYRAYITNSDSMDRALGTPAPMNPSAKVGIYGDENIHVFRKVVLEHPMVIAGKGGTPKLDSPMSHEFRTA